MLIRSTNVAFAYNGSWLCLVADKIRQSLNKKQKMKTQTENQIDDQNGNKTKPLLPAGAV